MTTICPPLPRTTLPDHVDATEVNLTSTLGPWWRIRLVRCGAVTNCESTLLEALIDADASSSERARAKALVEGIERLAIALVASDAMPDPIAFARGVDTVLEGVGNDWF